MPQKGSSSLIFPDLLKTTVLVINNLPFFIFLLLLVMDLDLDFLSNFFVLKVLNVIKLILIMKIVSFNKK